MLDEFGIESGGDELLGAAVTLDVVVEDVVEDVVGRQRVLVDLAGAQLGAGRLGDAAVGDGWNLTSLHGLGVAPAREFPDEGLGHVLDRREATNGIAVDGGVADGNLALVAGGEHQVPLGIGHCHQGRAAHPCLQVLLGQAREVQLRLEGVDHGRDRHRAEVQPRALGQVGRVVARVLRGVRAGQ